MPHRVPARASGALARMVRPCLSLAVLVSCGDGPAQPPAGVPSSLSILPASVTLTAIEQTEQLRADVRDHYGDVVTGVGVTWTTDRPGTVAVDGGTGLVAAVSAGTAVVTARHGALAARAQVTVRQEPSVVEKLGDLQAGFVGEPLPDAVGVRVADANGHPAVRVRVEFAVTSGGGSVAPASSLTDETGVARAAWTLGAGAEQRLDATAGRVTAEFQATAERLPLSIATDSLARARLTLPYLARLRARGGSTLGRVWSLGEGSSLPAGLRLDPTGAIQGVPVDVGVAEFELRVTDSEGGEAVRSLGLRVCEAPLGLELGEVRVMEAAAIRGCGFYLRALAAGAYHRVAVAGTNGRNTVSIVPVALHVEADTTGGRAVTAALRPAVRRATVARDPSRPIAVRELREIQEIEHANAALHREIRRQERELFARLAADGRLEILPDRSFEARGAVAAEVEPSPPTRTFRLYNPTVGSGERCSTFTTLDADLVTESDQIAVYERAGETQGISKANADRILGFYENHGVPVIERYFGGVSDVNADGRIVVVVDPTLNGVRAFVWAGDHTVSRESCGASNEMELVRMSAGAFHQLNDEEYWAFGGLVHEVKHVSSLYKRVRHSLGVAGDARPRFHPTWIEEGTAEIAKEMSSRLAWEAAGGPGTSDRVTGELMRAGIDGAYPEVYGIANLMNRTAAAFAWFTDRPNAVTFRPRDRGNVYGSGWHFHRFLRDWFGLRDGFGGAGTSHTQDGALTRDEAFVTALNDSLTVPGVPGIESVTGVALEELLTQHAVAMSVAGAEHSLSEGVPRFSSYDFPEAAEITPLPNAPGHYPWPVTRTGGSDDVAVLWADLAASRPFRGEITGSGVRFHDFRAEESGAGATILLELAEESFGVRVIVARIPNPAGS